MELRKITPTDWKAYKDFRLAALQSKDARAFGGSYGKESVRSEEEWKSLFDGSRQRFFYGIFDNDQIISVAGVYLNEEETKFQNRWIIVGVYTSPEFRGQGFSSKTIKAISDDLKSKNVKVLTLMVNSKQDTAIRVYEKLGFKTIDLIKDCVLGDGGTYDEVVMEKIV